MNIHHEKAQHNPQNLEIYRFQCNQNQPIFHILAFYFNKFHIAHAYEFIYIYMYIYRSKKKLFTDTGTCFCKKIIPYTLLYQGT